jgi:3-oxoadipate enol-lactonase
MPVLENKGKKIYYELTGHGEQTLVFIHGLGSQGIDWRPQIEFFSKHYRCLALDLRGHGKSSKNKSDSYQITDFAADVKDLLESLSINSAHLIGISLGGMVAFEFATNPASSKLVKSLTIVNSLPHFNLQKTRHKRMFYLRLFLLRVFGMSFLAKVLAQKLFPNKNQIMLRQQFTENFIKNDPEIYLKVLKSMPGWSVVDKLSGITCSVLFIASKNDYTTTKEKKKYAKKIANCQISEIKNSYHAANIDDPERFNHILKTFLTRL